MKFKRPCVKHIYPIYSINETVFRIGAQLGITKEFVDPSGQLLALANQLNGKPLSLVIENLKEMYPTLTTEDIEFGIDLLDQADVLEEYCELPIIDDRYIPNIHYFRRYLKDINKCIDIQRNINESSVLLLGLGGGGANVLTLLAGLGPKQLTIVDYDTVELSNLGRQLLYKQDDIGLSKAKVAEREFRKMNSSVALKAITKKIESSADVYELILESKATIVICVMDEPPFTAQRRVNEAIIKAGVPCIFGGSQISRGRIYSVIPGITGCFDCLNIHYTKTSPNFVGQFLGFQKINFSPPTIAYGPAIFQLSAVLADEFVRVLTNYTPPMSLSTQFEVNFEDGASFCHDPWPRYEEDCPTCGDGNVEDWEIFSYYSDEKEYETWT
ncbi:ThiF family adenylyltransferase [Streptococcus sp. 121]|uniref:ThiF family adenylyltransferase n=1 Tax=Streptococcus sp. 121 TaxID=2797637 RepID=UPI0018F0F3C7|nr:ThiF family adenylyltransferase [Streptococcus sp. 121]MBJ6745620.1 ThiF family adenylyltransferase [Streptococcus sp. 121]